MKFHLLLPTILFVSAASFPATGGHYTVHSVAETTSSMLDSTQSTAQPIDSSSQLPSSGDTTVDSVNVVEEQQPSTPENYSEDQNKAFEEAIEIEMAPRVRLKLAIQETIRDWHVSLNKEPDEWSQVLANLNIPRAQLRPTGREQVFRDYAMNQAKDVDSPVPTSPGFKGLEIPLSDIGQFLGISEDVSPTITYRVSFATNVAVVIYGADARKIADVQRPRFQRPGSYSLTWNLKDNSGKPMPPGDYIAEVQIGLNATSTTHIHVIRKKIVIP